MSSVLRVCRKCGAAILADDPEGLCAACVLETSLGMLHDEVNGAGGTEMPSLEGRPEELGDYQLMEEIGRGGQGLVYRARQKSLNRIVALKVIGLGRWATKAHIKRFRLEAEAAASLDHPRIVPIHEIGESDGSCYFSMKLVEGRPLDEVVKSGRRGDTDSSCGEREPRSFGDRRAAELIIKLARTVHYAHKRGILHRDIKPGNILIDADGEPHLTDFGLARLAESESDVTRTIEVLGTPSYMAPEQARGGPTQGAVSSPPKAVGLATAIDVYGLGAVFYHLLTDHPPFAGGTTYETIQLVLETEPRQPRVLNPKVDRDLSTVCLKCLEKGPERRYPSALALAEDLERWLKHEPIQAKRSGFVTRSQKWVRRKPAIAAVIALSLTLAAAVGVIVWKSDLVHRRSTTGIAVLPFENLSNDKEDAFFADGLQDDILTKLAKIADLKVISRTSVMQYRSQRNTRQVGEALGVSHVLEGSVRKTGAWLHINAQLIDTRTDRHVWAEQYDRDLKDVFAIQSEIAQRVAEQLHAKISAAEKVAIERRPTTDLIAFDLYTRGQNLLLMTSFGASTRLNLLRAANLLDQAVAHDPSFFQAYCQLAHTHDLLYFLGHDRTPARLALAETAIDAAFHLRPNAAEAHLARAENLYRGYLDYNGALVELEIASQSLPNHPDVFALKGYIERRQGRWEESTQNLERAIELDPRNLFTLQQIATSYGFLRRYAEARLVWNRVLAIEPNNVQTKVARSLMDFEWKADIQPLHRLIDSIRTRDPAAVQSIAVAWFICALAERNAAAAKDALIASGEHPLSDDVVQFNRPFVEGLIARMTNDTDQARAAFMAARVEQEKTVQVQPNYGPPLCVLGLIDAALGRKDEALREGWHAVELLPVEKDAINGPLMIAYLAMIAAWAGDKDLACEQLATAIRPPSRLSYGQLKLLPFWDPLRGDPRFEKIVASLAPKEN
jgi:serine/threonine protein kinase/tetratricopeptide (TPR) repeat protein